MKTMIKMEEILQYVLENLDTVTLEQLAEHFGYNQAYAAKLFRDYFEIPFQKYVRKLRLRKAAQSMYDSKRIGSITSEAGYQYAPGFSNAFSKEFGLSPRAFINRNVQVPDMPLRSQINHANLTLDYNVIPGFTLIGDYVYPKHGDETNLLDEAAYYHANFGQVKTARSAYGIWWNDAEGHLIYVVAHRAKKGEKPHENQIMINIPRERYAVFTMEAGNTPEETAKRQRMLLHYVFKEWQMVNKKVTNKMGITFELFGRSQIGVFVPLIKGMYGYETIEKSGTGSEQWVEYINDHIRENLTVQKLANRFNYSETIFRSIFYTRYGLTPADYIMKRRLILAAEEVEQGMISPKAIAARYGFRSVDKLYEKFYETFEVLPEQVGQVSATVISLPEFYENNKNKFRISYEKRTDFSVLGQVVDNNEILKEYDIPGISCYWFEKMQRENITKAEPTVALWGPYKEKYALKSRYRYFVGPVADQKAVPKENEILLTVTGGNYAVFETITESDAANLLDHYFLLERCAFHSWIRENRIRYDEKRITFVLYKNSKMYFYVPIKK